MTAARHGTREGCFLPAILALTIVACLVLLVDMAFPRRFSVRGVVKEVQFEPAHTRYYMIAAKIPASEYVPDRWIVVVQTNERDLTVWRDAAPGLRFGDAVTVDGKRSRLCGCESGETVRMRPRRRPSAPPLDVSP